MFFPYIILFIVVFVSSGLFGNDIWSSTTATIITTVAFMSAIFLTALTTTTISLAIAAGLKLVIITLIAMFTGVGTGVLTKYI